MPQKNKYTAIASLLIAVVLLAVLIGLIDTKKLARVFGSLRVCEALAAFGAFCLAVIAFEGARVKVLFADYPLSLGTALKMTVVGLFFGNFTPAMVGAEIYKAHLVRSLRAGFTEPLIRLFLLRIIGLAVTAAGALGVMLFDERFRLILEKAVISTFAGISPISVYVLVLVGMIVFFGALIRRAMGPPRPAGLAVVPRKKIVGAFKQISLARWFALIGLSALVLGARAVFLIAATRALSGTLGAEGGVLAAAGSVLAGALPFSFGGLGVQEGALAGVLYALSVPEPTAVAVALLNRGFIWLAALAGGLIYLISPPAPAVSNVREG